MQCFKSQLNKLFVGFGLIVCAVLRSFANQQIDVIIFLEEQNSDLTQIVQNAVDRYSVDHKSSSTGEGFHLDFSLIGYNRMISDILSLDQHGFFSYNLSTTLRAAIFIHISSHELILSSILERSNILTVGLFQTNGIPRTQVRIYYQFYFLDCL